MIEWIPVTQSVPPEESPGCSEDVIFTDGLDVYVGYKYLADLDDGSWFDYINRRNVNGVTHWMPPPRAPEEPAP